MNKLYYWLLHRQREFHYILLFTSLVLLLAGIIAHRHQRNAELIILLSFLLIALCLTYLYAWQQYCKHEHYGKKIIHEYRRIQFAQPYKLDRLSQRDHEVLSCLLQEQRLEEITRHLGLSYASLYRCIQEIKSKLDLKQREDLHD